MKLLVTGASGFLGSYLVREALRRGHTVRALVRPAADLSELDWSRDSGVELVRADLRSAAGLTEAVRGVECVIHAAAAKSGDVYDQYAGTVIATENLLNAMTEAGVRRMVAISSFSVYDFLAATPLAPFDEQAPLENDALDRDAYAHTKLVQERLIREHAAKHNWDLVVVRPGMLWGKDQVLNAWAGIPVGKKVWLRTGAWARIPLSYVENCAEAIVMAAESGTAQGKVLNVVDDALPTQREFTHAVLKRMPGGRLMVPVPYSLLKLAAWTATLVNRRLLGGRARVPGLFVPCRLAARAKPLVYSNRRVKEVLGWKPRYTFAEALERSLGAHSDGAGRDTTSGLIASTPAAPSIQS